MAIKGIKNLCEWVKDNDLPYWKVYSYGKDKNNYIRSSKDSDSLSLSDSIADLERFFSYMEPGRFIIICKPKPEATRGLAEIVYDHSSTNQGDAENISSAHSGFVPSGFISVDDFEKRLTEARNKWLLEDELKQLKQKVQDQEKTIKEISDSNVGSAIGNVLKTLTPHLPAMVNHFAGKEVVKIAVSGYGNQETKKENKSNTKDTTEMPKEFNPPATPPANADDYKLRGTQAIEAWQNADPEGFISVLEKIASIACNQPEKYKQYIPFLLNA